MVKLFIGTIILLAAILGGGIVIITQNDQFSKTQPYCQESEITLGILKALNCRVIVELKPDTPQHILDEILKYLDGEVIYEIDGWNAYEIKYKKPISVEKAIEYLDSIPQVTNALPSFIMSGEI